MIKELLGVVPAVAGAVSDSAVIRGVDDSGDEVIVYNNDGILFYLNFTGQDCPKPVDYESVGNYGALLMNAMDAHNRIDYTFAFLGSLNGVMGVIYILDDFKVFFNDIDISDRIAFDTFDVEQELELSDDPEYIEDFYSSIEYQIFELN